MNVLVLGGTGNIGSTIVRALVARGARVAALCRATKGVEQAEALSAVPLPGDIKTPETWIRAVRGFDAVIHAACTFDDDMGTTDTKLTGTLIEALSEGRTRKKLLYTAGAWCYGDTAAQGVDEFSPFNPVPEFKWGVENSRWVLRSGSVDGITVHPSNVVDKFKLGVPPILLNENRDREELRAPGTPDTRWPLVEREDLAQLYCLVLEKGKTGHDYMGTSEEGVPLRELVAKVARHLGLSEDTRYEPVQYWVDKYGGWARGYALSQVIHSRKAINELGWEPQFRFERARTCNTPSR